MYDNMYFECHSKKVVYLYPQHVENTSCILSLLQVIALLTLGSIHQTRSYTLIKLGAHTI